eukprot:scaffold119480_cov18-Tisochrysis_lutea.AAC.1
MGTRGGCACVPVSVHHTCTIQNTHQHLKNNVIEGCGMTADTLEPIIAFENAGHCVITKKIVLENWFGNENVGPEVPEGRQELGMEATRCRT